MDQDFESPFARVPAPGAGPSPLQEGPLTYERMLASAGRARLPDRPQWRIWVFWLVFLFLVLGASAIAALRL